MVESHLKVDDVHSIYYETHGNPEGSIILFLHGGPGIGTTREDLMFFDLKKHFVILLDQRGAGKSMPKGELKQNTTQHLIEDINQLLSHLGIDKPIYLFGGSWGSTLALLYALQHPKNVSGMILRGLFTANHEERAYFEKGKMEFKFPDVWKRFESNVPESYRSNPSSYYFENIVHGTPELQKELALELSLYAFSMSKYQQHDKIVDTSILGDYHTKSRILSHYSLHDFFIEDNYILHHKNKLQDIPITIVHGTEDYITPVSNATEFAKGMPNVTLQLVEAGHSSRDTKIKEALIDALDAI